MSSDALVNGVAGACGGILAQFLTYPLQAVNTRQQVRRRLLRPSEAEEGRGTESTSAETSGGGHGDLRTLESGDRPTPGSAADVEAGPAGQAGTASTTGQAATPDSDIRAPSVPRASPGGGKAGVMDTAREMWEIVRAEGVGALYRGLEPSLVGTACSQGVYYYFYQLFRDRAELLAQRRSERGQGSEQVAMVESLVVAALAGCVNVMLTNPIWVIVTRMQTQSEGVDPARADPAEKASSSQPRSATEQPSNSSAKSEADGAIIQKHLGRAKSKKSGRMGAIATTLQLFDEAGILGFWKGVLPTLIMVSNPALQFAIYETLLARITVNRPRARGGAKSASAWEIFLLGAVAKLGATVVTYPLLVVKARLQATITDPKSRYSGTLDALVRTIGEEGLRGLYKGMGTKIVQSVFAASVLFLTKEELVKFARFLVERRQKLLSAKVASA